MSRATFTKRVAIGELSRPPRNSRRLVVNKEGQGGGRRRDRRKRPRAKGYGEVGRVSPDSRFETERSGCRSEPSRFGSGAFELGFELSDSLFDRPLVVNEREHLDKLIRSLKSLKAQVG